MTRVSTINGEGLVLSQSTSRGHSEYFVRGAGFEGWYKESEIEGLDYTRLEDVPTAGSGHLVGGPIEDELQEESSIFAPYTASAEDPFGSLSDWMGIELLGEEGTEPDLDDDSPLMSTSSWEDVREKAKRLRAEMAINVTRDDGDYIEADVQGESGTYQTYIQRHGQTSGNYTVTGWGCTCGWGQWAWKRQHTYVGRMCSHALALYLEMQSLEYKKNVSQRMTSSFLSRVAGKQYTAQEEQELIDEKGMASQLSRLRLENSHYLDL